MANDATIVDDSQSLNEEGGEQRSGSKIIPMPADKVRAWHRELSDLRAQTRQSTQPSRPTVPAEQQEALDLIGDNVSHRIATEFSGIQDQIDDMSLERGLDQILRDPQSSLYADEMQDELKKLMRDNPRAKVNDLIGQAQDRGIARAFKAGKLTDSIREEEAETARVKSTLSVPRSASNQRGAAEKPLNEWTAEELAANPAKFEEAFAARMGRARRR